jgi:hypothetical protein
MEKWTPTADLQIVSDNLMQCLSVKKSQLTLSFFHKSHPGFPNYLAQFFLQNPSLQPAFHRMPVEGGVI